MTVSPWYGFTSVGDTVYACVSAAVDRPTPTDDADRCGDGRAGRCNGLRAPAPRRAPVCACVCACLAAAFLALHVYTPYFIATMPNVRKIAQKNCPAIRIESVRVLSFANSRARFTATPHSPAGQRCHLIKNTHKNKSTQSAERSRLGPCTMETEHREHGRTRGAAAASSEPGARGISAVDHAWYVTCVSTARV